MPDISLQEKIAFLSANLGPTITAVLSGTRNRGNVNEWINTRLTPEPDQIRRIAFAYAIYQRVRTIKSDEDNIARRIMCTWFLGSNVGPGYDTPLTGIREDRFAEVEASLERMLREDQFGKYDAETLRLVEDYQGIILDVQE